MTPETLERHFDLLTDAPNAAKKLRELVLQLAVQGKLVEQDPSDEPAGVLLERIEAEKKRLIEEKKIRKSKPLPPIEEDEITFEVPISWTWVRLGEVGQIVGGGTPKTSHPEYFADDGIAWITPADLYELEGKSIARGRRDISTLGLQKSSAQLMPAGTVVFSSRAPIGYVAIAENEVATNQGFKSCVPFVMTMNEYIYYFLKSAAKEIDTNASGTTFKEVSGKQVSSILLPLPPLEEQKRIVAKVDELMGLIDRLEAQGRAKRDARMRFGGAALGSLLSAEDAGTFAGSWRRVRDNFDLLCAAPGGVAELRKAVLQLAVQGKLVSQDPEDESAGVLLERIELENIRLAEKKKIRKIKPLSELTEDEIPFSIPKSWQWTRLDRVCYQVTDGTHHTPTYVPAGVHFLSVKDISGGRIDLSDTRFISQEEHEQLIKRCHPELHDILLTKVGTTGIAKVVDVELDFSIFVSVALLKFPQHLLSPYYFELLLNSPLVKAQSEKNTQGVGNKNLVLRLIKGFVLPLPPLNEQKRIVAKVDELMGLIDALEEGLKRAQGDAERLLEAAVRSLLTRNRAASARRSRADA